MKRLAGWIKEALIFSGWLDREMLVTVARVEPEMIGQLWGIPTLYDTFPDLIGK